ncbi:MAG: hypothetical protein ACREIA_10470, partial [Opitutaceae bacterium]
MIAGVQSSRVPGLFGAPLEGVRRSQRKLKEHAKAVARGGLSPENVAGLVEAEHSFKASVAVVRAADRMIGT